MVTEVYDGPVKLLVLGSAGMIGSELMLRAGHEAMFNVVGRDLPELDVTQPEQLAQVLDSEQPDYVINCTGFSDVENAEQSPLACKLLNHTAVECLAQQCALRRLPLVQLSSDYVFDGHYVSGYSEDDAVSPLGVYGESKWQGEEAIRAAHPQHIILRTSWVFGSRGENYLQRTLQQARAQEKLQAVNDRYGCPTAAHDVARVILAVIKQLSCGSQAWGTYHYCGAEVTSRFGFSEAILRVARNHEDLKAEDLEGVDLSSYETTTGEQTKPVSAVLKCQKLMYAFGVQQKPWRNELAAVLRTLYAEHPAAD